MNPRVAALPQYKGFPIPFFAKRRLDGTPDFKITDEGNRQRCAIERRCWVCGQRLGQYTAFIGGPVSVKNRLFVDGPMHHECALDALAICPFMLGQMDYAANDAFHPERIAGPVVQFIRERPVEQRAPDKLGLLISKGFDVQRFNHYGELVWFFKARTPDTTPIQWHDRAIRKGV